MNYQLSLLHSFYHFSFQIELAKPRLHCQKHVGRMQRMSWLTTTLDSRVSDVVQLLIIHIKPDFYVSPYG